MINGFPLTLTVRQRSHLANKKQNSEPKPILQLKIDGPGIGKGRIPIPEVGGVYLGWLENGAGGGVGGVGSCGIFFLFRLGYFVPQSFVAQDAGDQGGVHGVTGAIGYDPSQDGTAEQCQVADKIEDFVPHELVGKTEGTVFDSVAGQHNAVFAGGAANQSHVAHRLFVFARPEGARARDLV